MGLAEYCNAAVELEAGAEPNVVATEYLLTPLEWVTATVVAVRGCVQFQFRFPYTILDSCMFCLGLADCVK